MGEAYIIFQACLNRFKTVVTMDAEVRDETSDAVAEATEALNDALTIGASANGATAPSGTEQRDKEALAQGLFHLFRPAVDNIDGRVKAVRQSQVELRAHIDNLAEDLRRISDCRAVPIDLDPYVKRLLNTRRRIGNVATLLQSVQERVNKVNYYVNRDKAKKNQMIKASTTKALDRAAAAAVATSTNPSATNDPAPPLVDEKDANVGKNDETREQEEGAIA